MTVTWRGNEVTRGLKQALNRGLFIGANIVRNEMVAKITKGPKTGRVYVRRGIEHQASAPGEPPASDTGRLVNSIDVDQNLNEISATINVGANYAAALEFGTENMEPRPYARPSLNEKSEKVEDALVKESRRYLNRDDA